MSKNTVVRCCDIVETSVKLQMQFCAIGEDRGEDEDNTLNEESEDEEKRKRSKRGALKENKEYL